MPPAQYSGGHAHPILPVKPVSDLLHRTPWWALVGGGFALFVALALFTTPFHLIRLEHSGATPEENRAIQREIKSTFSEGAIDMARGIVREMRNRARDPADRKDLDRALDEIEQARKSVREAGRDAMRTHRDAVAAGKDARQGVDRALRGARVPPVPEPPVGDVALPPLPDAAAVPPPLPELPPDVRANIRNKVTGDLYRIGVGTGLILIFIPFFVLAVVSKIFIDRSRASQRMAEVKRREADYHRMSRQVTEAKLAALQAQVEPHFLYNTLASVQALTEVDPAKANAMTGHLIQYLRNALPKMRESVSTVGQEMELVRAYLNILQMRMGERLAFEIAMPPELAEAPFPPLMLPSLVENAIKHGLEPLREGGRVTIAAEEADGRIRVTVTDTGRGFGEAPGEGVGLANIRERLAALYGGEGRLTLEANEPRGVRAILEVPRKAPERVASGPAAAAPEVRAPAAPRSTAARTLAAMGTVERAWRKGLSFTFVVLVSIAAVLAGLAMMAFMTGALHVQLGDERVTGAVGALVGMAAMLLAFGVVVLALGLVFGVVYGLGFLFAGLVVFIPVMIVVSIFPTVAPFVLVGLGVWWFVRRNRRDVEAKATPAPPSAPPPAP
ncbi:MAG TPA: histidine kinase [Usitatibacter sp.]|nr:histidine kinase [Usitatibacter sp.]